MWEGSCPVPRSLEEKTRGVLPSAAVKQNNNTTEDDVTLIHRMY